MVTPALTLEELPPMLLTEQRALPRTGSWLHELKVDGARLMSATGAVRLRTKGGADATAWFPEVVHELSSLPGGCVLDGEVAVLDDIGRSDFDRLMTRVRRRRWYAGADPVIYCVFDLLVLRGKDLRAQPIEARKAALRTLVKGVNVLYMDSVEDGRWLYEQALLLELEGVVAKRIGSTYQCGVRSRDWVKIKRPGAIPAKRFSRKEKM